ncbi:MAG: Gfo/Idh/MocA family oxidoreductase [Candidatus Omnitrophica bacterium]|nr:Gfo/Idh/MocA family oxidoreductase [Candidatus Omnitrophota bacterium]
MTRRHFLGQSASLGLAGMAAPGILSSQAQSSSPNDRIRLGFIGIGDRASQLLDAFLKEPGAEVTALCDVWKERLDAAVAKCPKSPKTFNDYRDLLASGLVDAVVIGTPPHWHALMAIHSCEAGMDVYMEKPMTMGVGESLAVKRAVDKHKRITQIGTQIHAESNYRKVVDIVRSGVLGKISVVRTTNVGNQGPDGIGHTPNSDPPEGLDWDMWCGPAPMHPFNPLIVKRAYENSSFMEYSNGWTPGMAPHIIDLPYWALELGHPTCVSSSGGRYIVDDVGNAYDTHEALFQYPDMTLTWGTSIVNAFGLSSPPPTCKKRNLAISFQGVNGTLVTDYNEHDIHPERGLELDLESVEDATPESPGHYREWLDCIRSREQPSCHIGYHYKIDVAINLSLIALKLGRSVRFDPETETIPDDPEANRLLVPEYRDPWEFPRGYL